MIPNFYRTRIAYEISTYIAKHREQLLTDLVAYSQDPIRYEERLRILIQLADYEKRILEKIRDFETEDPRDLGKDEMLTYLQQEVQTITDIAS